MTTPIEQKRAIKNTRDFLAELVMMRVVDIRQNASSLRKSAGRCLRHYPMNFKDMEDLETQIDEYEDMFKCTK